MLTLKLDLEIPSVQFVIDKYRKFLEANPTVKLILLGEYMKGNIIINNKWHAVKVSFNSCWFFLKLNIFCVPK